MGDMSRAVVVTGASTGIGRAAVKRAAEAGAQVFPVVRKPADAKSLKAEFGEHVTPIQFDVTDAAAVKAGAAKVAKALGKQKLFGLINNAGVAVPGPLLHLDADELRRQLDVNLIGVHLVTQAFAPLLGAGTDREGEPGRIVMISSVAGENGNPFLGAYAASKHALEGYSQSLRRELMLYGVDVIVVAPGAVATPIWGKADGPEGMGPYRHTDYFPMLEKVQQYMLASGKNGLDASVLGDRIWRALTEPHPKTRYRVVKDELKTWTIPHMLPERSLDRMIAERLGLTRQGLSKAPSRDDATSS